MSSNRYYAFNTGTTVNPAVGGEYADLADSTILVLRKVTGYGPQDLGKTPIALSGWGHVYGVQVGQIIHLTADQSGRDMGRFVIEAIVAGDSKVGTLSGRKVRHYVMK